jgi:hypothetical protein
VERVGLGGVEHCGERAQPREIRQLHVDHRRAQTPKHVQRRLHRRRDLRIAIVMERSSYT